MYTGILRIIRTISLIVIFTSFLCTVAQAADVEQRSVTGYYYDPNKGDIMPKYDELSPSQVKAYLHIKKNPDYLNEIEDMSYRDFRDLDPGFVMYLPLESIEALNDGRFRRLSDEWKNQMTEEQIHALDLSSVRILRLTEEQREFLNPEQIQSITRAGDYRYVPVSLIPELTDSQISSINDGNYRRFTDEQKLAMTEDQIMELNTASVRLSRIPETQREALTTDQIQSITRVSDYRYVPVSKISDLTTSQVSSINRNNFNRLSNSQVQVLTEPQVLAISDSYYDSVKNRLTDEQRAWRP